VFKWNELGIPIYELNDYSGEIVHSGFYQSELRRVEIGDEASFKIIQEWSWKVQGNESRVVGVDQKYDHWVSQKQLMKL
jgi:hypothetical protein